MKRKFRFLSLVLAFLMLLPSLFACNNQDGAQTSDTEAQMTQSGEPTFRLNGIKMTDYTLVYSGQASEYAVEYFNIKLDEIYEIELETTKSAGDGYQIFIDKKGSDASIYSFFESCDEGMIGYDGKNVYILAKDKVGLCSVIDAFFAKATTEGADTVIKVEQNEKVAFAKDSLKVMSYNVLYDMYYDDNGELPRDITALANFIKEQAPDVFGTQETMSTHKEKILSAMTNYECYEGIALKGTGMANMIFWNADKYKKVSSGFQYLTSTPFVESKIEESNSYRGFSYVVLESLATHKQFMFVNVHVTYRNAAGETNDDGEDTSRYSTLISSLRERNARGCPLFSSVTLTRCPRVKP
ncbi:MAG: hypothetical protein E7577_00020 [Ruminococcaceae bacterium]|nr:hypothetical protein [Oscillospiraceae bacterium]